MPKKYTKKKLRGKKIIGGEVIPIGPGRYTSQKKDFLQRVKNKVKNTIRKIKKLTRKKNNNSYTKNYQWVEGDKGENIPYNTQMKNLPQNKNPHFNLSKKKKTNTKKESFSEKSFFRKLFFWQKNKNNSKNIPEEEERRTQLIGQQTPGAKRNSQPKQKIIFSDNQ